MRGSFLWISLFAFLFSFSQNTADVKTAIDKETDPSKKIELILQKADETKNSDPQVSFEWAQQAAKLASSTDGIKLAKAEYYMALYYNKSDKVDSVLYFTQKNIRYLKGQKDQVSLLANFNNLEGGYYMRLNKQRNALERFYESLKIADASNDALSKIKALGNIGWAYMELNQFDTAIAHFKRTISIMQSNNLNIFAAVYNNVASCYGDLKKYDSAKHYVLQGISIARNNNDLVAEANGLNILGNVFEANNQYKEELETLMQAKTIREKLGDPFYMVSDMATIAGLYFKTGEYHKGIEVAQQALAIATKNNITIKYPMIYQSLINNYEGIGDYKSAAKIYRQLNSVKDSMYTNASPQALADMQTKYETEKKERMIQQQQSKLAKQKIIIGSVIALVILGGLLAFTQYRRYQWKQEANLRSAVLKQQQESNKAVIQAEEAERQRIAKDLHDGVGQMMSAAKMTLSAYESNVQFKNEDEKQNFEKIISLVDESCREVRAVSHNMMPNALLKNSLSLAIREFLDKLDHKKLQVHLYTEGLEQRLDANIEIVLYRVIQECVHNVIKHANANTLDISILKETDQVTATVEDNGQGFDSTDGHNLDGMGLKNIRARIEYLKGTVDFDSSPGRGTLVALHVPL